MATARTKWNKMYGSTKPVTNPEMAAHDKCLLNLRKQNYSSSIKPLEKASEFSFKFSAREIIILGPPSGHTPNVLNIILFNLCNHLCKWSPFRVAVDRGSVRFNHVLQVAEKEMGYPIRIWTQLNLNPDFVFLIPLLLCCQNPEARERQRWVRVQRGQPCWVD